MLHHLSDRPDEHAVGRAAADARQLILKLRSGHDVDLRAALGSVGHTIAGLRPYLTVGDCARRVMLVVLRHGASVASRPGPVFHSPVENRVRIRVFAQCATWRPWPKLSTGVEKPVCRRDVGEHRKTHDQ